MPTYVTYQLEILLSTPTLLTIGRFGFFDFPQGRYVYTGSALRNIEARIARHLLTAKKLNENKLRWHIDYLLASPAASILKVTQFTLPECQVNQRTQGEILIAGFGSSDCRARCASHLKYLGK